MSARVAVVFMMIIVELYLDVARDVEVDCTVFVIPFKGDSVVQFAFPVCGDLVERLEVTDEVIGVFLSFVFDAKVFY